jgi:hypothetical protein
VARAHGRLLLERIQFVVRALFVDVAAGQEGVFTGTGENDAADAAVGLERVHGLVHLAHQLAVHRVQHFGAMEGDDADAVFDLGQDAFVGHCFLHLFPWLEGSMIAFGSEGECGQAQPNGIF